ncbi:MAG TPA: hypothetical protein PLI90_01725 [Rhodocyclaceae bacterium]|nr:hypothetical protein [Rhodocyclaceae bacterium]
MTFKINRQINIADQVVVSALDRLAGTVEILGGQRGNCFDNIQVRDGFFDQRLRIKYSGVGDATFFNHPTQFSVIPLPAAPPEFECFGVVEEVGDAIFSAKENQSSVRMIFRLDRKPQTNRLEHCQ